MPKNNSFVATENTEAGPDAVNLEHTPDTEQNVDGKKSDDMHKTAPAGSKVVRAHHHHEPSMPSHVEEVIVPRKPKDFEPAYAHAPVAHVLYANVEPDPGTELPVVEGDNVKPVAGSEPISDENRFRVVVGFENEVNANAFRDSLVKHATPLMVAPQQPDTGTTAPDVDGSKADVV